MKTALDPTVQNSISYTQSRPQSSRLFTEQYRAQSQEMSISLTTKEGDRITIRQASTAAGRSIAALGNGGLQTISQGLMEAGLSIELEGDLSYQEIKDLTGLFKELNGIATDFFNGNLKQAVAGAANIGDMGSITELNATFSRTSVLAGYMQGNHPLPALFETPIDLLSGSDPHDPSGPKSGPASIGGLPLLWQQFIGELIKLDAPPPLPPPSARNPHSAAQAGERMLARGRETTNAHPRLTPLMPSMANLAIDQASRLFKQGHELNLLAKELTGSFRTAFNNWIV